MRRREIRKRCRKKREEGGDAKIQTEKDDEQKQHRKGRRDEGKKGQRQ